ncbi:MAG: cyclic pyranopterin monophosphate synthase MoaC [Phycisphaerales bacterium]|nr:MAG: cyclic pyranopterin monophosphate synthase MoaC [Phycisphaerales bacterium]
MADRDGMVDVSGKDVTVRTAKASGTITLGEKAFQVVEEGTCTKGDVLATAKVAAIQAAKSTPALIPMCHPLMIEAVDVDFTRDESGKSVTSVVTVRSTGKTGVEMEALTAAGLACLTIYDMLKYIGKDMVIGPIKLLRKTGGKSGDYAADEQT